MTLFRKVASLKNIYINESHWLYTFQIYTICKSSVETSHTLMEELLNLIGFNWLSISSYCFRRATFLNILFQKRFYFTATLPFCSCTFYLSVRSSITFTYSKNMVIISYVSIITQSRIIVYLIYWLHKVPWSNYLLSKLTFNSQYILRTPTISKQLYFFARDTFSENSIF